jgi:hypothetical protein
MASDILTVPPSDFFRRKDCAGDDLLTNKYKEFFTQYNCFSDAAVIVIQPSIKQHNASQHLQQQKKIFAKPRENKSIKKHILGILNVINNDNYTKMLIKTKILLNSTNLKEIFTEILEKCTLQIFYLNIYFNLINDILVSLNETDKQSVKSIINDFFKGYLDNQYILGIEKTGDAYHDFCMVQKNKMIILSKNLMLLEFIKNTDYINVTNLQTYSEMIFSAFLSHIDQNIDVADTLLQVMLELSKCGIKFDESQLVEINTIQKIKFIIDDILTIQNYHR